MAHFYMHFVNRANVVHDSEGFDAADVTAAHAAGLKAAGKLIADEMAQGHPGASFILCLEDHLGRRLETLTVSVIAAASLSTH